MNKRLPEDIIAPTLFDSDNLSGKKPQHPDIIIIPMETDKLHIRYSIVPGNWGNVQLLSRFLSDFLHFITNL